MITLGEIQTLVVVKQSSAGAYLRAKEGSSAEEVLLPNKQVPPGTKKQDEIEVFVYRDSEDNMIATTQKPKIRLGQIAPLKVKQISNIGAFLDWGLPKDLLLPFREQTTEIKVGKKYVVRLYIDKSERLCASMRIYEFLRTDSPYKKGDRVKGIIYDMNNALGALVAVDHRFNGLLPKSEIYDDYYEGDIIEARVARVKEDGKLDLSFREESYLQMDTDAELILQKLNQGDGFLPLHDKSTPEQIKGQLKMSKGAFKKAVGRLLKEKKIELTRDGIELKLE